MGNLLENSKQYRDKQIKSSIFNNSDAYAISHSRALSDGDIQGKGELDKSVGSSVDIEKRNTALSKSVYSNTKPYN